jgi:hypothetical protein
MTRRAAPHPTHPFIADDGVTNWRGDDLCAQVGCAQPAEHPVHQLPDTDPAVTAEEARRLGEREDHPDA